MSLWVLLGLGIGAAYGYVAQRGAFCMNSGFRMVVATRDTTKVKAFVLAIAVQMIGVPILFLLDVARPTYPSLFPVGAVVGGTLFGASMRWAGGCAAGVWYKLGAGSMSALAAVAGMIAGAAALEIGPLAGLRLAVQSAAPVALDATRMWMVAPLFGIVLLAVLFRARPGIAGSWPWRRTGALMGIVGIGAWFVSGLVGRDFGMAVIPGSVGLVAPGTAVAWDIVFVLGVPLGAFLAARKLGPVKLARVAWTDAMRAFSGGVGLGVGASLAAGCTVGHGLTGVALVAPGSILAIAFIFVGSALSTLWQQRRVAASMRSS